MGPPREALCSSRFSKAMRTCSCMPSGKNLVEVRPRPDHNIVARQSLAVIALEDLLHGCLLLFRVEPGAGLRVGAGAVVGDKRAFGHAGPLTAVSKGCD